MAIVRLIDDAGDVSREIHTESFSISYDIDGEEGFEGPFSPVVTQELEASNTGQVATTTTQCGDTKKQRVGTNNWQLNVEAIITDSNRDGNLSLSRVGAIGDGTPALIDTDFEFMNGRNIISEVTITSTSELTSIRTNDTDGKESAYGLSMTIGKEESN